MVMMSIPLATCVEISMLVSSGVLDICPALPEPCVWRNANSQFLSPL
jgi:hypothetical protein